MAESAAPSGGRVFISYRREETAYAAGWLYDRLAEHYGRGQVFKDVDSIELGDDFVDVITAAVGSCDVLLALVGDEWMTITDAEGRPRLSDPDDFVRLEIEAALTRNVRVIPILVDGAAMPRAAELPPGLARLVRRQALELSPARFDFDTSRLLKVLDRTLAEVRSAYEDVAPIGKVPDPGTAEPRTSPEGQEEAERVPIPRVIRPSSPPAAPTGLSGSSGEGRVDLRWDLPVADAVDVVAWQVRRDGTPLGDVTEPRASDGPPGPGSYRYTVVAVGADGQRSAESEPSVVVVPSPPAAPTGLSGSSGEGRVDLRWDPPVPGSLGVARWEVYRDGASISEVTSPNASDEPPGSGSYRYTVVAVGADGQRSAESIAWVRPGRQPPWLIPALAILAAVLATAGLLLWAPWQPDGTDGPPPAGPAPAPPAGMEGNVDASGTTINLQWDPAPPDSAAVASWEVLRDGVLEREVTDPAWTGTVIPGFDSYTVVAIGEDGQRSAESESWNSPPAWQTVENTGFPETFSAAGVAKHNDELWVVGGQDDKGKRDEVRFFDPQTKKWEDGPPLPEGVSHAALVSTGDKLYLLGGLTAIEGGDQNVPLRTVYSLDTENPGWKKDEPLPAPRFSGAAAWDGQRLVFAGGAEQIEPGEPRPAKADIWELRSGQWESIGSSELQPARERLAAATDEEGTIWFAGGADHKPQQVYDVVDVLTGNEVSGTAIRTAVQGAAAIWTPEMGPCVLGGSTDLPNQPAKPVADVECLGGIDAGWPDLPKARYNAGAVVIDSTVYVVGGGSEPADMVLALRFG